MTLGLTTPAALAALAALVLPLVIHLARRSDPDLVWFAALRFLEQRPRPRSRLRFDEWLLLIVRLLLIALIVLFLAQPLLDGVADRRPRVAVLPGAAAALPGATRGDVRGLWLAEGFPSLDQPAPPPPANFPSLLRELDADLPPGTPLTVIVPATLDGAGAERVRLSRRVTWRIVPHAAPRAAPAPATPRVPPLVLHVAPGREAEARYFQAVATAWGKPAKRLASAARPARDALLVWLDRDALPPALREWVATGGTVLLPRDAAEPLPPGQPVWRDAQGRPIATAAMIGQGRAIRFVRLLRPLDLPLLLEPTFPAALVDTVTPPPPAPGRVAAAAYAPELGGPRPDRAPAVPLQPWLALAIAVLLLIERWLATTRRRTIAP